MNKHLKNPMKHANRIRPDTKERERVNIILPGDKGDVTMLLRKILRSFSAMHHIKTYLRKLQKH
jgi:hypothetical protein